MTTDPYEGSDAEHGPDIPRNPLPEGFNADGVKLKVIERWQLIKWDGEAPFETDDPEVARQHPACAEIITGGDDIPTTVIYRRPE